MDATDIKKRKKHLEEMVKSYEAHIEIEEDNYKKLHAHINGLKSRLGVMKSQLKKIHETEEEELLDRLIRQAEKVHELGLVKSCDFNDTVMEWKERKYPDEYR